MNINFMLVFDVIIGVLGVYITYCAQKMKSGEVAEVFVTAEEMKRCIDKKAFITYMYSKTLAFGIISVLFGLEGIYNDFVHDLGNMVNIVMILVFLAAWMYFSYALRKARKEFFKPF